MPPRPKEYYRAERGLILSSARTAHCTRHRSSNVEQSSKAAAMRAGVCSALGMRQPSPSRKLLIASVGVATINYVAACVHEPETTGNLVAPPASRAGAPNGAEGAGVAPPGGVAGTGGQAAVPPTSGNLVAPPPTPQPTDTPPTSGNLMPPPPASAPPTSGNLVPPPKPLPTSGVKPPLKTH